MAKGVLVIDDYGHHPTEIRATLVAARKLLEEREGGRLIAIFQPHRYSRTVAFLDEFANSLSAADFTYLLDIYAASEKPIPGVSSKDIVARISPGRAKYQPDQGLLFHELTETLREGDLVITLGAGDVTKVGPQLLSALIDRS
jgi:UDP-N-acetylmuramate--alanine ligase